MLPVFIHNQVVIRSEKSVSFCLIHVIRVPLLAKAGTTHLYHTTSIKQTGKPGI
jgi:hypothetical protein